MHHAAAGELPARRRLLARRPVAVGDAIPPRPQLLEALADEVHERLADRRTVGVGPVSPRDRTPAGRLERAESRARVVDPDGRPRCGPPAHRTRRCRVPRCGLPPSSRVDVHLVGRHSSRHRAARTRRLLRDADSRRDFVPLRLAMSSRAGWPGLSGGRRLSRRSVSPEPLAARAHARHSSACRYRRRVRAAQAASRRACAAAPRDLRTRPAFESPQNSTPLQMRPHGAGEEDGAGDAHVARPIESGVNGLLRVGDRRDWQRDAGACLDANRYASRPSGQIVGRHGARRRRGRGDEARDFRDQHLAAWRRRPCRASRPTRARAAQDATGADSRRARRRRRRCAPHRAGRARPSSSVNNSSRAGQCGLRQALHRSPRATTDMPCARAASSRRTATSALAI